MNVAINGFGRIGRQVFRILFERGHTVRWINSRSDANSLVPLIKYDSTYGRFPADIREGGGQLLINDQTVRVTQYSSPYEIPWSELDIDLVVESSGKFFNRADVSAHLRNGAKKVIISAPSPDADIDLVFGVNEHNYLPEKHHILSNASCTTNSMAAIMKVLDEQIGVQDAMMTTIHSFTNDQRLLDNAHKDPRRARAASVNIIPTSTGAAKAVARVLPAYEGHFDGIALRVPTPAGSLSDISFYARREVSASHINQVLREAAETRLQGIVEYSEEPIVSSDIVGNPHSAVVDGGLTMVVGRMAKVFAWYDNEWGYSSRMVDMLELVQNSLKKAPPQLVGV